MTFKELCEELEKNIQDSYEQGVTTEEAERLAGKFLAAQFQVSSELTKVDLDSRMKKSGVKSVRGAIYLDIVSKGDKRPTEANIAALIDTNTLVESEQRSYDEADVEKASLDRYYDIFLNAHIHFRTIAKGSFSV